MSTFVSEVMRDYKTNSLNVKGFILDDNKVQVDKKGNTIAICMQQDKQFKLQELLNKFNDLGYEKIYEMDDFIFLHKDSIREVEKIVHYTEGETIAELNDEIVKLKTHIKNIEKGVSRTFRADAIKCARYVEDDGFVQVNQSGNIVCMYTKEGYVPTDLIKKFEDLKYYIISQTDTIIVMHRDGIQ